MPHTSVTRRSPPALSPMRLPHTAHSAATHSPFSSPTLHRHDDPFKAENLCFATQGSGSVVAAAIVRSAPTPSLTLSSLSPTLEKRRAAPHVTESSLKLSPASSASLSPEQKNRHETTPSVMRRLAQRLSLRVSLASSSSAGVGAHDGQLGMKLTEDACAPSVVSSKAPLHTCDFSCGAEGNQAVSPSKHVDTASQGSAAMLIAAPKLLPFLCHSGCTHEPFQDLPPATPTELRRAALSSSETSPGTASIAAVATSTIETTTVTPTIPCADFISTSSSEPSGLARQTGEGQHSRNTVASAGHAASSSDNSVCLGSRNASCMIASDRVAGDEKRFFRALPQSGAFVPLIEWLLRRGERRDVGTLAPAAGTLPQRSFFNEDYITKLCTAATSVLAKEPSLLELDVLTEETLVVVGDIHGQFQDLYSSVLCHQHDRHRCNLDGRDRRFLFMGDYVDRGPHSLEVVLLLLALKVEYPTLVYLTRGNHEEEKTSRIYGFLTEARTVLGADAGAAVWSAVNKVFLDLPLAAVVETPFLRFAVMHGGLSPALQFMDQIAAVERHSYSSGDVTAAEDDLVTGILWSDPTNDVSLYKRNSRGCGYLFGPAASTAFCTDNQLDFICRAHQLAMDGYFWTHDHHVVTVFSAPNYCGINGNRGAVMVVKGRLQRPLFKQYDGVDGLATNPVRSINFAGAALFF